MDAPSNREHTETPPPTNPGGDQQSHAKVDDTKVGQASAEELLNIRRHLSREEKKKLHSLIKRIPGAAVDIINIWEFIAKDNPTIAPRNDGRAPLVSSIQPLYCASPKCFLGASGSLLSSFFCSGPQGGIDSLLFRINSLLPRIKFPYWRELIPCSVAQGISSRGSRKRLNS